MGDTVGLFDGVRSGFSSFGEAFQEALHEDSPSTPARQSSKQRRTTSAGGTSKKSQGTKAGQQQASHSKKSSSRKPPSSAKRPTLTGAAGPVSSRTAALPGAAPVLPYVATQMLASLGSSPTNLTGRTLKRIMLNFPVPQGQTPVWAHVVLSTRVHGLVITGSGIFIKDGFPCDKDVDADGAGTAALQESTLELDGIGFHYLRWENFDPGRISHVDSAPTFDGERFLDGEIFRPLAMACVRLNNQRVLARRSAKKLARTMGIPAPDAGVRSVCFPQAQMTARFCFGQDGLYKFRGDTNQAGADPASADQDCAAAAGTPAHAGTPANNVPAAAGIRPVEVPQEQYDAVLALFKKRLRNNPQVLTPGVEITDVHAAGAFVRCGNYSYTQALHVAQAGCVKGLAYNPDTGAIICSAKGGISAAIQQYLSLRTLMNVRVAGEPEAEVALDSTTRLQMACAAAGQALAQGVALAKSQARSEDSSSSASLQTAGAQAAQFAATNVAARAGQTLGATGARIAMGALGLASGPVGLVASLALGEVCGKAGLEAFSMAKDLFIEPRSQIWGRLLYGVAGNVIHEYLLTEAETEVVGQLLQHIDPALFQQLGYQLAAAPDHEAALRALLVPLVERIQRPA